MPVVSPFNVARIGPVVGRGGIVGADEVVDAADENVDDAGKDEDKEFWDMVCELCDDEDQARQPRLPHDPGRPTKEEVRRHMVHRWPFRAWCRHCLRGRGVASPHRTKTAEGK